MHVAEQHIPLRAEFFQALWKVAQQPHSLPRIGDLVGADVNHRGARANPIRLHVTRFAHRRDDDVRAANYLRQIARFGMADCHRGIRVHQQKRHGLANNVAAAQHHGVRAFHGNLVAAQNFHAAGRRACHESRTIADQLA